MSEINYLVNMQPVGRRVEVVEGSTIDQKEDSTDPYGIRGISEIPFIPSAPAIIAAIYNASGFWIDQFPIAPELFLLEFSQETENPVD